ncbi:MAG: hypothetical protein ACRDJ0_05575 [Actinomycetota bacterium]
MSQLETVADYYRVSQARDEMRAPELYRDQIERYCAYKNLQLAETFSDIDYSPYLDVNVRLLSGSLVEFPAEQVADIT